MSQEAPARYSQKSIVEFLSYHGFTADDKTVNKGTVTQSFSWEANSVILVKIESSTKTRTATAHLTFFNHDGTMNTLEDKQTIDLKTEADTEKFKEIIDGYMLKTPYRKSQSGSDFFASVMQDGKQIGIISLNRLF